MNKYAQCFVAIPFIVVMFQFYSRIISLQAVEKQRHCRALGITYTTLGTVCLIFRSLPLAFVGLILFMLGLRLIAYSLDRINKIIFIDRFDEESQSLRQTENDPLKVTLSNSTLTRVTQAGDVATVTMQLPKSDTKPESGATWTNRPQIVDEVIH